MLTKRFVRRSFSNCITCISVERDNRTAAPGKLQTGTIRRTTRRNEENHKILSGQSVSWPRFKLGTSRIQIRNVTISENLFPVWEEVNTAYLEVPSQDLRSEQNHGKQHRHMRTALLWGITQPAVVSFLPTFRDNLSVPPSRVKILTLKDRLSRVKILTLEHGTDRLSRNVGNEVILLVA